MAACESLQHMFENPLPSEASLSSWNPQLGRPSPPMPRSSSVTELFGELHFEESPALTTVMPSTSSNVKNADIFDMKSGGRSDENERKVQKKSDYSGPRHRSGGSLQLCTEGLGFESLGDVEDTNEERIGTTRGDNTAVSHERDGDDGGGYYCFWGARKRGSGPMLRRWRSTVLTRREMVGGGSCFPPPISIVNRPWVSLRGYRCDGRFMLKEVTVPAREFLHASREGGRLRLDFVQGVQEEDNDHDEDDVDVDADESDDDDDVNEPEEEEVIEGDNEEVVEEEGDVGKL